MINSVQNLKFKGNNPLTDYINNGGHYVTPEIAKDIVELSERNNDKKGKKIGLIIASSAVGAALTVLAFTKGVPKNTYKWLEKLNQRIGEHIKQRKLSGNEGHVTELFHRAQGKVLEWGERARSINNVASIKDLLFMKLMYKNKSMAKIHKSISAAFERLARGTVNRRYADVDNKFGLMFDTFNKASKHIINGTSEVTVNGVTKTSAEWYKEILNHQSALKHNFNTGFSENARQTRYLLMTRATQNLDSEVWQASFGKLGHHNLTANEKLHSIKESKLHTSFIAEDILAADKAGIAYNANMIRDAVINDTKEILDIYKAILPKKEYAKILQKSNVALKDLKKAVNTETNEFFDKLRDLKLGSAGTDVLSIVGTAGAVGAGLALADNQDERVSALLKYGIPAIGGIGASFLMTVSLVSGFTAMLSGLLIGEAMNIAGAKVDKLIKQHHKQKRDKAFIDTIKAQNA